ncbi:MAG: hypothetical protein C4K49_01955 [Candidatus Thorarchaeota archaeon]|nr:MAG: hypothetical protein C4K49_01955 [Candidatus Thorarchaeota archaeon]
MRGRWWAIAKAEFLVRTSRLHRARWILYLLLVGAVLLWALAILPLVFSLLLSRFGDAFWLLVSTSLPGFMRSIMLPVWLFVLIIPLSNSLDNVKTDQWEILFSSGVQTRDVLLGSFLGKLPVTGLLVAVLAPLVVYPFAYAYGVSVLGQVLMITVLILFSVSTIWLSNVLSTALHAKIGESPRGDDIGKALSWGVVPIVAVPAFCVMYWMGSTAQMMGTEASVLFPSTWCADVLTWVAVYTGNLPASSMMNLEAYWLSLSPMADIVLLLLFTVLLFVGGFRAADSVFAYGAGPRFKKIAQAGPDNIVLKFFRRLLGQNFGTVLVTSIKDYTRKLQNVAKIAYGFFLSVLMALVMAFGPLGGPVGNRVWLPVITPIIMGMMLGMLAGVIFGGVGLFDSRNQLWIVKSTPSGVRTFITARVVSYMLIAIPYAFVPSLIAGGLLNLSLSDTFSAMLYVYTVALGCLWVGIGITALNPSYDSSSSSAFTVNTVVTIVISMITIIASMLLGAVAAIREGAFQLALVLGSVPCFTVGLVIAVLGTMRLNYSELA